jgi:hypothetical protein
MPRIVTIVLLVGMLAAANAYAPEVLTGVLVLVALYLVATHADQVNRALTGASAGLARGFRSS